MKSAMTTTFDRKLLVNGQHSWMHTAESPNSLLIFAVSRHRLDLAERLLRFEGFDVIVIKSCATALISLIDCGDQQISQMLVALDRVNLNIISQTNDTSLCCSAAVSRSGKQVVIIHGILVLTFSNVNGSHSVSAGG
jgi:hypothetical protein